jgi:hypothetical protein
VNRISPARICLMTLAIVGLALLIQWDRHRLNTDFDNVMSLLKNVWIDAGVSGRQLIVRFNGDGIVVTGEADIVVSTLKVPTLHDVNYDTTLGDDMIVYHGVGTSGHNKREHGGDLTLRSWFGFKKYVAVNCNGVVTEGRYPGEP